MRLQIFFIVLVLVCNRFCRFLPLPPLSRSRDVDCPPIELVVVVVVRASLVVCREVVFTAALFGPHARAPAVCGVSVRGVSVRGAVLVDVLPLHSVVSQLAQS